METLPELDVTIVEVEPYCHACRKHQALSTREARLSGQAYNSIGFEASAIGLWTSISDFDTHGQPLEDSPDEDSDDEDDSSESVRLLSLIRATTGNWYLVRRAPPRNL